MSKITKKFIAIAFISFALFGCTNEKTVNVQPVIMPNTTIEPDNKLVINTNQPTAQFSNTQPIHYGRFFIYQDENTGAVIQPGTGGILVEKNGCLLIESGGKLQVPVFSHKLVSWDEATETLTYGRKKSRVGQSINGSGRGNIEPSKLANLKFVQQAKPECVAGRKFMVFWG